MISSHECHYGDGYVKQNKQNNPRIVPINLQGRND